MLEPRLVVGRDAGVSSAALVQSQKAPSVSSERGAPIGMVKSHRSMRRSSSTRSSGGSCCKSVFSGTYRAHTARSPPPAKARPCTTRSPTGTKITRRASLTRLDPTGSSTTQNFHSSVLTSSMWFRRTRRTRRDAGSVREEH